MHALTYMHALRPSLIAAKHLLSERSRRLRVVSATYFKPSIRYLRVAERDNILPPAETRQLWLSTSAERLPGQQERECDPHPFI